MNNEDNQTLHGVNGNTSGTYRPLYPARTPALNTYLTLCFWFLWRLVSEDSATLWE